MENLIDPEEMIMCPYNSSHHIRQKRFNTHLVKCKKSYPNSKLVECDFNVNHKIPEPEKQYHHKTCPDRRKMEHNMYEEAGTDLNKYPVNNYQVIPPDECWDAYNEPTYDPKKHCETKGVLRHMDVESSSKRKEFRLAERRRLGQFANVETRELSGPSMSSFSNNPVTSTRRDLPETSTRILTESTPRVIGEILDKIHSGAKEAYLPRTKK